MVESYEGTVQNILPILGGIREDQLTASIPCSEWNVHNLIAQNIKVAGFTEGTFRENNTVEVIDINWQAPLKGEMNTFVVNSNALLELIIQQSRRGHRNSFRKAAHHPFHQVTVP